MNVEWQHDVYDLFNDLPWWTGDATQQSKKLISIRGVKMSHKSQNSTSLIVFCQYFLCYVDTSPPHNSKNKLGVDFENNVLGSLGFLEEEIRNFSTP